MAACVLLALVMVIAIIWMTGEMYGGTANGGVLGVDPMVAEMVDRGLV